MASELEQAAADVCEKAEAAFALLWEQVNAIRDGLPADLLALEDAKNGTLAAIAHFQQLRDAA